MRQLFLSTVADEEALDADYTSASVNLYLVELFSAQLIWTDAGSLAGTVYLQGSNDGVNWVDLDDIALSGEGTDSFVQSDVFYKYARFFYDRSAGDGTLSILLNAKGGSAVQA